MNEIEHEITKKTWDKTGNLKIESLKYEVVDFSSSLSSVSPPNFCCTALLSVDAFY